MTDTGSSRRRFLQALAMGAVGAPILGRAQALEAALTSSIEGLSFRAGSLSAVRRLRDQYMLAPDLIYLNHASIGTVPRPVLDAHIGYLGLCETHPSLYVWGGVWRELAEGVRAQASVLLNCLPDDLAITHNTTEGFNLLAHGLPLSTGDEVLFSSINHAGASVAWDALAERRGFTVRRFPFPVERGAELTQAEVVALHAEAVRPETRVLVIPHVDNMIGLRHPVREIAAAVRNSGVEYVLVDGAQSVGMIPVDIGSAGVDAYCMSPHKWVQSPKGLGLLYVSEALRQQLPPYVAQGAGVEDGRHRARLRGLLDPCVARRGGSGRRARVPSRPRCCRKGPTLPRALAPGARPSRCRGFACVAFPPDVAAFVRDHGGRGGWATGARTRS